ncbi:MAG: hypothetical protein ACYCS8_03970 [Acidithiobacillus sp.]
MTAPDKIYATILNGHVTMAWSDWREDKTDVEYIRADIHKAAEEEIRRLRAENVWPDDAAYRSESYEHRIRAMQDEIAMLRELPTKMVEEYAKILSLQPPPINITVSKLPEWIKEVK